jgi:hypothetical protein
MGKEVASGLCTVVDDATLAQTRGAINVDDEGNEQSRSVLIENGKLVGYMHDRLSAHHFKLGPTNLNLFLRGFNLLDQQARDLSKKNAADSIALEKQFSPETEALRRQSAGALLPYTQGADTTRDTLRSSLYNDFNNANTDTLGRSALLDEAIAKARNDLALGGQLDVSTRNEVTRRAGASAAGVSGGRVGLGRDISARDLGLRSLDLQNSRLAAAGQFGNADQAVLQAQAAQRAQNNQRRLSTASLISDLGGQTFAERLGLAQFGQSIQRPQTGLDPSSLVDLTVGNTNASNAAAQQQAALAAQNANNNAQLMGQGIGLAASLYSKNSATKTGTTAPKGTYVPGDSGGYNDPNTIGTYYIPRR